MVVDEESGLLVTPGSEVELAKAIERILYDDDLCVRIAADARRTVRNFTATAVAERLEVVYTKVAPPERAGGHTDRAIEGNRKSSGSGLSGTRGSYAS